MHNLNKITFFDGHIDSIYVCGQGIPVDLMSFLYKLLT